MGSVYLHWHKFIGVFLRYRCSGVVQVYRSGTGLLGYRCNTVLQE